jgi:hypothetical protein
LRNLLMYARRMPISKEYLEVGRHADCCEAFSELRGTLPDIIE